MIIIVSDSEIMYFPPPSFHFKKGLAKFTIEVRLIRGFRQKGAFSALSRGASYTRMRLIPEYIRYVNKYCFFYVSMVKTSKEIYALHTLEYSKPQYSRKIIKEFDDKLWHED